MNKHFLLYIFCFLPFLCLSQVETDALRNLRKEINKEYSIDIIKGKPIINYKKKIYIDGFGDVKINGKKQFKYKRFDKNDAENKFIGSSFGIYKRKEKNIIFTSENHTVEMLNGPDDYVMEFVFPTENLSFLSKKVGTFSWLAAVKLMLYEKVIDIEGKINVNQLNNFIEVYNDIRQDSELYNKVKNKE